MQSAGVEHGTHSGAEGKRGGPGSRQTYGSQDRDQGVELRHRIQAAAAPNAGYAETGIPTEAEKPANQLHSTRSRPVDLARYKAASARSRVLSVDSAK